MKTTKTRRLRLALVLAAATALTLGYLPAASASPHLLVPGSADVSACVISGTTANPPLSPVVPAPGSFYFNEQDLECTGGTKAGVYKASAWAKTTDIFHSRIGENALQGGSVSVYKDQGGANSDNHIEYHTGKFVADEGDDGNDDLFGKIHFVRLGALVIVDGPIWKAGNVPTTNSDKKKPSDQAFQAVVGAVPGATSSTVAGVVLIYGGGAALADVCVEFNGDPLKDKESNCTVSIPLLPWSKAKSGDNNQDGDSSDPGDCPSQKKDWTDPGGFPTPCTGSLP